MKIIKFSLQHKNAFSPKDVDLNSPIVVFYSGNNSTGKTTLMRAILYTLGFSVPSTELVHFEDFEFRLDLLNNDKFYTLQRKSNLFTINEQEFDLPVDLLSAHMFLFNVGNAEILSNLLGVIYFDQEKGWTLLNRGTIIGLNRFSVEGFFRGLKEDESNESYQIVEKIKALNKKIAEYRLMLNVAEYQVAINQDIGKKLDYLTYDQDIESALIEKKMALNDIEEEVANLNDIIKKNKQFSDYLEMKKIYVINPNDPESPIRVTKSNLFSYDEVEEVNLARKSMLIAKRNSIKREISSIESAQEKQLTLLNLPTIDEEMTRRLAGIKGISAVEVKSMLSKLIKEKNDLSNVLKKRTKTNNTWIKDAYKIIAAYAKELGIPFDYKIDIFTSNLKTKSGAILHKMVFIYKLAYIKLLSQKLGYPVPIFCDSPSGREVNPNTIDEMLLLLKRDFSNHQIFIASIHKYESVFNNANIFELNGSLFNEPTLFDDVPVNKSHIEDNHLEG